MAELIEGVKDTTEFLKDVFDACGKHTLIKAVAGAVPWFVQGVAEGLAESLPFVNFIAKKVAVLLKDDPETQGRIACTLAYQRSVQQAILQFEREISGSGHTGRTAKLSFPRGKPSKQSVLNLSLDATVVSHPFIAKSDEILSRFFRAVSLDQKVANKLLLSIHGLFLQNLQLILIHPLTEEKFKEFAKLVRYDHRLARARRTVAMHNEFTRWRYEGARVLGDESFALNHVYTDTDCGKLLYEDVSESVSKSILEPQQSRKKNPFSEQDAVRQPLLKTVLELLGTAEFREPIVIQGVAGIGKSSFTLRLAVELMDCGFVPMRVELGDVDLTKSAEESLPSALRYSHPNFLIDGWDPKLTTDDFRSLVCSQESIDFVHAKVSPYVIILDGWDEIVTGASGGFRDDVEKLMNEIRSLFFQQNHRNEPQVHVVITGRPTIDVTKNRLLRDKTPLLTIRPYTPQQLESAFQRFVTARNDAPFPPISIDPTEPAENHLKPRGRMLKKRDAGWLAPICENYKEYFGKMLQQHESGTVHADLTGNMAVLGFPLLAQLTFRLIANLSRAEDVEMIVKSPSTLYRALIDLTHEKGAKVVTLHMSDEQRHRVSGPNLRWLLWEVASAITAIGSEEISRDELKMRLDWEEVRERFGWRDAVDEAAKDKLVAGLVIAFFFTEGRHQGCRFLHKSFREYLFAEGVVEQLKHYGRNEKVKQAYAADPELGLTERKEYWKDFKQSDPRHRLVHSLTKSWSTSWVTAEVQSYLQDLLQWEFKRSIDGAMEREWSGQPTKTLSFEEWRYVRDGLADAWDWWAEGLPLRCGLVENTRGKLDEPLIVGFTEKCSPQDPEAWRNQTPAIVRITTVDSRLGDAFFLLTALIHAQVFFRSAPPKHLAQDRSRTHRRRYQVVINDEVESVRFRPTGVNYNYFQNYASRINSAGWRPQGNFPSFAVLDAIDLSDTNVIGLTMCDASMKNVILTRADMSRTDLTRADLSGSDLSHSVFIQARLIQARMKGTDLSHTYLIQANLSQAKIINATMRLSDLTGSKLSQADLSGTDFTGADLTRATVKQADLTEAELSRAELTDTDFTQAILTRSNLSFAHLGRTNLTQANLDAANLTHAVLKKADFTQASLADTDFRSAKLTQIDFTQANFSGAKFDKSET